MNLGRTLERRKELEEEEAGVHWDLLGCRTPGCGGGRCAGLVDGVSETPGRRHGIGVCMVGTTALQGVRICSRGRGPRAHDVVVVAAAVAVAGGGGDVLGLMGGLWTGLS